MVEENTRNFCVDLHHRGSVTNNVGHTYLAHEGVNNNSGNSTTAFNIGLVSGNFNPIGTGKGRILYQIDMICKSASVDAAVPPPSAPKLSLNIVWLDSNNHVKIGVGEQDLVLLEGTAGVNNSLADQLNGPLRFQWTGELVIPDDVLLGVEIFNRNVEGFINAFETATFTFRGVQAESL